MAKNFLWNPEEYQRKTRFISQVLNQSFCSIGTQDEMEVLEQQRKYSQWLKRARTEDFTDIAKMGFLTNPGTDLNGRPIVVFIGRFFPTHAVDLNKAVSYFIHFMDSIASREFVFIYFHTLTTEDHHLNLTFLKDFYELLDVKYRRNMNALYIIHGTIWQRIVAWFFLMANAASIRDKVNFVGGVQYLNDLVNVDQLEVPPFIMEYDIQVNGPHYYQPAISYKTDHGTITVHDNPRWTNDSAITKFAQLQK